VGVALFSLALSSVASVPARATWGNFLTETKGLDSCAAPSIATMQAFWNGTPYYTWYIYVGGISRACAQPNLTASWVQQVSTIAGPPDWGLVPIWVGPQAPCTTYAHRMSSNTTTAYNQGYAEAQSANGAVWGLGMGGGIPIVVDIEAFNTSNSTCLAAVKAYVRGWSAFLQSPPAQPAGVYGSTCGSGLNNYAALSPHPDWIWGAYWNGNPSTSNMACITATNWANRQRHKQYQGGHNETWNGKTVNVDSDCANGPNFGPAQRILDTSCG
jgi:hypothetical protein